MASSNPHAKAACFPADAFETAAARLDYGLLDRAPDAAGLQAWGQAAHAGASLTVIAQGFLSSPEYQALHPVAPNDVAFVNGLYQDAPGRPAEASGERHWFGLLENGASRAEVAPGIADGDEAQNHFAGQVDNGFRLA